MAVSLHYFSGNCSSPEAQAQIKQNFIEILNASLFKEICNDPAYKDDCKVENVKVTCSEERKRRALGNPSNETFQVFNGIWTRDLAIPVRCSNQLSYEATDVGSWSLLSSQLPLKIFQDFIGISNLVEVLKNFQASRRNRNLRSSLRDNMVSFDFIPAVQYMMYFIYIYIFHS